MELVLGFAGQVVVFGALSALEAYRVTLYRFPMLKQSVFPQNLAYEQDSVSLNLIEVYKTLAGLGQNKLNTLGELGGKGAQGLNSHEITVKRVGFGIKVYIVLPAVVDDPRVLSLEALDERLYTLTRELYMPKGLVRDIVVTDV